MKLQIKSWFTGGVLLEYEADTLRIAVEAAVKSGAKLVEAALHGADLARAELRSAKFAEANLYEANLYGAKLAEADLKNTKNADLLLASTAILPADGPVWGWKKCQNNVLVKVAVGAEAKRSNATGRKCRAEYVKVLEIIGAEVGIGLHDRKTEYRVGQTVRCDKWDADRWRECSGGIHFYLTREEAEAS